MYTLRCNKCGYSCEYNQYAIKSANINCPKCGYPLIIDIEDDEDDNLPNLIEKQNLTNMKEELQQKGNNEVWKNIESITIPTIRLEFRELFFKAGGEIPKGKDINV